MAAPSIYDFTVKSATGKEVALSDYRGKVMLIVNTASECGFTPQYAGLEQLHKTYGERGLAILAFPCNQFGAQEPGSNEEIQKFCALKFRTTFPVMAKVDVNGESAAPVFKYLRKELPGIFGSESIKWNFTKFLLNRKGVPIKRYSSTDTPESMAKDIEKLLDEPK